MDQKNINDNPISIKWKEKYLAQSDEVKRNLDLLKNMNPKDYQLQILKKQKVVLNNGDVFVLSPRAGIYFYGKVVKAYINHISEDPFIHNKHLVFIFKTKSYEKTIENYASNYDDLLINPSIVDISYWTRGFFLNISNEPISDIEINLDYGFYSIGSGKYLKENGTQIYHQPSIIGPYGITTITGIAYSIEKELLINPQILQ